MPAAALAGRMLASRGNTPRATKILQRTWARSPHPDLATVYAFAKPGESPRERLKRVKYLASLTPGDIEGQIAVATAAIEAHAWQEAEAALSPYLDEHPPARVCALMARIEAGEGNKGREREWLARGLRAPRDRAWIADGYVSDRWLPVSPLTGQVDAFQWKAPVDAIGRGDETLLIEERVEPEPAPPPVVAIPKPRPPETVEPLEVAPKPSAQDGAGVATPEVAPEPPPRDERPDERVVVADRPLPRPAHHGAPRTRCSRSIAVPVIGAEAGPRR